MTKRELSDKLQEIAYDFRRAGDPRDRYIEAFTKVDELARLAKIEADRDKADICSDLNTLATTDRHVERRRFKVFVFEPEMLLDLMNVARVGPERVKIPSIEGVPPDASVDAIYWDQTYMQFVARVSHSSFCVVQRGQSVPEYINGVIHDIEIPRIIPGGEG